MRICEHRYGVWGDWADPYLTLNPGYEAAQLGVFGAMFLNGHIYRGRKPVHWSPSSRTALAEAVRQALLSLLTTHPDFQENYQEGLTLPIAVHCNQLSLQQNPLHGTTALITFARLSQLALVATVCSISIFPVLLAK